jgi:subtilisin family serine protease
VPELDNRSLQQTAWHLDSRDYRGSLLPRTDIRATEAWEISDRGAGARVAVIDSTLQWDHPDLINQLACPDVPAAMALPEETCGYDFVDADGDTRLSEAELNVLKPGFQDSFRLDDRQLLAAYPDLAESLGDMPPSQKAPVIRDYLRYRVEANFHGTWAAGVIAAQSSAGGLTGVAPEADILPVRVFDLAGFTSIERLIEATGYAAARDVDVINLSLGSLLPSEALTHHLFDLLDQYPDLVIVASAGNSNLDGVGFPAAIPGVLSVGATTLAGERAPYSTYGGQLDVVAPGGDLRLGARGGILTTGGTWLPELWEGMAKPRSPWGYGVDPLGQYVRVQGTSFAAPNVTGVVALMRGEEAGRQLNREELLTRLLAASSPDALSLSEHDRKHYRLQRELGFGTVFNLPFVRRSGIHQPPEPIGAEQYYFGAGLVDALRAIEAVQ